MTRTDFDIGPVKLFVSTLVCTLPLCPGPMTLSNDATVHPHDGRASLINRSAPPLFSMTKSVSMTCPLATVPSSCVSAAIDRRGFPVWGSDSECAVGGGWAGGGAGAAAGAEAATVSAPPPRFDTLSNIAAITVLSTLALRRETRASVETSRV